MLPSGDDTTVRFDAFISYSHAADGKLAPAVQRALHQIARPWYRMRALRTFRDKTSLSVTAALWPSIERDLAASRYLIVLASPEAAASAWVAKEVQWWLEHRSVDTVMIVVTDGEIRWNAAESDFDWKASTAVPALLAGRFAHEPLWADLRFARSVDQLSLRHSEFREAVVGLAAAIHGRAKDELDGEDVRQHRRTRWLARLVSSALVVLTLAAVVLSGVSVIQRDRADREADTARRNEAIAYDRLANLLASESNTSMVSRHDPQRALLLALTAADMRTTEVTRTALYDALESQPHLTRILTGHAADKFFMSSSSSSPSGISGLLYHPRTGELISSGDDGKIIRWDPVTGQRRVLSTPHYLYRGGIFRMAISPDGARLVSVGVGSTAVWDMTTGRPSLAPSRHPGEHFGRY